MFHKLNHCQSHKNHHKDIDLCHFLMFYEACFHETSHYSKCLFTSLMNYTLNSCLLHHNQ